MSEQLTTVSPWFLPDDRGAYVALSSGELFRIVDRAPTVVRLRKVSRLRWWLHFARLRLWWQSRRDWRWVKGRIDDLLHGEDA